MSASVTTSVVRAERSLISRNHLCDLRPDRYSLSRRGGHAISYASVIGDARAHLAFLGPPGPHRPALQACGWRNRTTAKHPFIGAGGSAHRCHERQSLRHPTTPRTPTVVRPRPIPVAAPRQRSIGAPFLRFRGLSVFGRRPSRRGDGPVMPASETHSTQHRCRHHAAFTHTRGRCSLSERRQQNPTKRRKA
jgi:hypothetical protein